MKHDRKLVRVVKSYVRKRTTEDLFLDSLRRDVDKYGYVVDKYVVYDSKVWYLVINNPSTMALLCVMRVGYLNNELFGVFDNKMYLGGK